MQIITDTREQTPYTFSRYPVEVIPGALTAGDYSLPGFTDEVAIERKELSDLLGCLTHDRDRFTRELERLRGYQSAALLIEAPLAIIQAGRYRSHMKPDAAVQSIFSIMQRYRMPVYFAKDRTDGEAFVYDFLRHFLRHAAERYKAVAAQETR
jgi:ERCC4-type nuclease